MRRTLLIAGLILAASASADAAPPTVYTISLTPAEVQEIGQALGSQPYSTVSALIAKIQQQVIEANKGAEPKPPPKAEKKK